MQTKKIILLLAIMSLIVASAPVKAWIEPTTLPPGNNVFAPLNSSSFGQSKIGGLILNLGNATNGLIVRYGLVGIGTDNPQAELDVVGKINSKGLEINSDTRGVLLPRTTPDKITAPTEGMIIFNTDQKKFFFFSGSVWKSIEEAVTDERKVVEYSDGEGRTDDYYCKKKNITADGKQEDWANINDGKLCGSDDKICQSGGCKTLSCGIDFYKTGLTCSAVGTSYYSPIDDNDRYECTTKPANSTYTGSGGGVNNCPWSCNSGYIKNGNSCVVLPAKVITVVDSNGDVGYYPSITIGSDGFARMSYKDQTNRDLKFIRCTNMDCTTRNIATVDSIGDVGNNTSIVLGSDGFARISYDDTTNGDLKFVQCTNIDCTTKNITTVDSAGNVGGHTSIKLGLDDFEIGRASCRERV